MHVYLQCVACTLAMDVTAGILALTIKPAKRLSANSARLITLPVYSKTSMELEEPSRVHLWATCRTYFQGQGFFFRKAVPVNHVKPPYLVLGLQVLLRV